MAAASRLLRPRPITSAEVERWLGDAVRVFLSFTNDQHALERVQSGTTWAISEERPPDDNIWSGEVVFSAGHRPAAICYSTTFASRLPGALRELAWQGAMDHFVGHLYPYHRGATAPREYDEGVACRHQHMAAQVRGRQDSRYRLIARAIPWVYRAHKGIPLSNYVRLRS